MKRETREWVDKVEADLRVATILAGAAPRGRETFHDHVGFHCQQSAEKYLKAWMQELGLPIPHIHDLARRLGLLAPHDAKLATLRRFVIPLTRYAVEYRYPGVKATKRQVEAAVRYAGRIREAIRKRLGLPA